jgi:hypothetical protein
MGLDLGEGVENDSMEISRSEKTNDIVFQERSKIVYVTVQSEILKDNKDPVVYLIHLKIMVLKMFAGLKK